MDDRERRHPERDVDWNPILAEVGLNRWSHKERVAVYRMLTRFLTREQSGVWDDEARMLAAFKTREAEGAFDEKRQKRLRARGRLFLAVLAVVIPLILFGASYLGNRAGYQGPTYIYVPVTPPAVTTPAPSFVPRGATP